MCSSTPLQVVIERKRKKVARKLTVHVPAVEDSDSGSNGLLIKRPRKVAEAPMLSLLRLLIYQLQLVKLELLVKLHRDLLRLELPLLKLL